MSNRRNFIRGLGATALLPLLPSAAMAIEPDQKKRDFHRVLTCNIRVALPEDEEKGVGWAQRKDICLKVISQHEPDIVGFQEVLKVQADDLRKYFTGYSLVGFEGPEMDANPVGYHGIAKNPIMFSNTRYELMAAGIFWLSLTPLVAGSKSWETARARHANWVRLREKKTGSEIRVVNLHLDHISQEAKIQQAKMVADESTQYQPDFSQILTGDFNTRFDNQVLQSLRTSQWKESYETMNGEKEAGFTGHEFEGVNYSKGPSKGRIDYIWYKGKLKPTGSSIIRDAVNGKFPSDHFFLQTDFIVE